MITASYNTKRLMPAAIGCALLVVAPFGTAQKVEQGVAIVSETIASRVDGFSYSPDSSSKLDFAGTSLGLGATGEANVKISHGKTEISGKFQKLPEPSSLGPFAVYILWLVTPEGRAINIGMLNREDDRARIDAVTPLSSFALIVTAEPHFAVSIPSKYVVLQNVGKGVKGVKLAVTSLAAREDYSSLQPVVQDKKNPLPLDLVMARYAMAIAQAAGAQELAKAAYDRARTALQSAEAAQVSKKSSDRARVAEYSREAIQAGEDARAGAETRRTGAEKVSQADLLKDRELAFKGEEAKGAKLQADLVALRQRLLAAEKQLPTPASRMAMASELLSKWFTVPPPTDAGLTVHVPESMFVKAHTDLVPAMQQRLSLATGALLGIGKLSVSVSPSVQSSSDVQKLALSQLRARAVMEWLQSMGVQAVMGATAPDAEASLAMGPGVDLVIAAAGS
jgi:outer membrane protein OmpA-like peptidoglycan-associated protein